MIIVGCIAAMRLSVSDCILWVNQRKAFGKPLAAQPVIQYKLAEAIAMTESCQAWLDSLTYQMSKMTYKEQSERLSGPIALLKFHSTRCAHIVAMNCVQMFGGRAITKSGMGQNVERFNKSIKILGVYGGSEEIMASLSAKQTAKTLRRQAPTARL